MYIGVDYYPEHWPQERWEKDAQLMKKAGFNVVRLAEFAWVKMEPQEGQYQFDWLDRAISILHAHGISVVLGTPTGSMPRWVALKYPEAVAVDRSDRKIPYGARKDNCPTSASYRLLSCRITEAMAAHFRDNPSVIGWQTDNEFGGPNCYCPSCQRAWHEWLEQRYQSIDRLNEAWGTVFWGHVYHSFEDIPLPQRDNGNPSQALDAQRFHSEQVVAFQREQVDILRRTCPGHFITHNFMGFYDNLDYYKLAEDLDFVSWDYYYTFTSWEKRLTAYEQGAAAHDLMRGLKKRNFWIMETSAGPTGQLTFGRNLRPGEMRRMNWQSVAHGADGLVWFRWRTCRYGAEQYWHGLLPHSGKPGRRYQEAARTAGEMQQAWTELEGSKPAAKVAICLNYEDRWAFRQQPNSSTFNYVQHLMRYYKAFASLGQTIDFVHPQDDLSSYSVVVAPTTYIITAEMATNLQRFAAKGGTLILSMRTGVKNEHNVPYDLPLPGLLAEVAGVSFEEYEALSKDSTYPVSFSPELEKRIYHGATLVDWVETTTAKPLAHYAVSGLESFAALTRNESGKGLVYYVGTQFVEDEAYSVLAEKVLKEQGVATLPLPKGVELVVRRKEDVQFLFVLNHTEQEVRVRLPRGTDLLRNENIDGMTAVPAGDLRIVKVKS